MALDEIKLEGASRLGELVSIDSEQDRCKDELRNNKPSAQMSSTGRPLAEPADGAHDQQQQQQPHPNRNQTRNSKRYARYGSCDSTRSLSGEKPTKCAVQRQTLAEDRGCDQQDGKSKQKLAEFNNQLVRQDCDQRRPLACKRAASSSVSCSSSGSSSGDDGESGGRTPLKPHKLTLLERLAKRIPGLGIMLALCASVFLGTAGMLVKLTTSVHGIQVAVFRAVIQMVFYCAIIALRGNNKWMPARKEWLPCTLRALLGGSSITFSYYALKLIPLGDATSIRFSLPIWTLIMSYFFLNESCSLFKVSAVVICVCGVVLIAKPDDCIYLYHMVLCSLGFETSEELLWHKREYDSFKVHELASLVGVAPEEADSPPLVMASHSNLSLVGRPFQGSGVDKLPINVDTTLRQFEGCMMALASSICLSMSLIALRLCKRTPAEITILWLSVFSVLIGSATLLFLNEWRLPDNLRDLLYIVLNGICGSIGQWFITSALKVEQSGIISLARTFDIEIAFLYSALLLNEDIRATSIIGSVMVSLGVIIVGVPKWLGARGASDNSDGSSQASASGPHAIGQADEAGRVLSPPSSGLADATSTTTTTTVMMTARPFEDKS